MSGSVCGVAYVWAGHDHVVVLYDDVSGEASLRVPAHVAVDIVVANLQLKLQAVPVEKFCIIVFIDS